MQCGAMMISYSLFLGYGCGIERDDEEKLNVRFAQNSIIQQQFNAGKLDAIDRHIFQTYY